MTDKDISLETIISEVNSWLETFCTEHDHIYLGSLFQALEAEDRPLDLNYDYTGDGVHLNHLGYEVLGKAMAKALTEIVDEDTILLLLGDSITAGFPEHDPTGIFGCLPGDPKHTFAYWVEDELHCKTINHGICGDTTTGMAERLGDHLKTEPKPDFVVVQGGANDCSFLCYGKTANYIADKIKINYRYIHQLCSWQNIKLIFIPMLPMNW